MPEELITVRFTAEIKITIEDLEEAELSETQAVQNVIGHTGAQVICTGDECDC